MAMTTGNSSQLIRSELWSSELKDILRDELNAQRWVRILNEFPDGTQFSMPSVGDLSVDNYVEDDAVVYRPMDTGEWTFTINQYLSSGTYITKKNQQDAFYSGELEASFVPKQNRAIMEHYETTTLAASEVGIANNYNGTIDTALHRFSGGNSGKMELADFAYARWALKRANVPDQNLVAIVDPSVEYEMNTLTNLVNVSNNPRWEGIVADGIGSGIQFVKNIYGFDVYTSNYLADAADTALEERDDTATNDFSTTNGKVNLFFSATPDILPLVGAWRQMPEVDYEYNKDRQRHEYLTTARYGVKLHRPENLISIVTTPTVT